MKNFKRDQNIILKAAFVSLIINFSIINFAIINFAIHFINVKSKDKPAINVLLVDFQNNNIDYIKPKNYSSANQNQNQNQNDISTHNAFKVKKINKKIYSYAKLPLKNSKQVNFPNQQDIIGDIPKESSFKKDSLLKTASKNVELKQETNQTDAPLVQNVQDYAFLRNLIEKHIEYPYIARRNGYQGIVTISFTIKNGVFSNIEVIKSSGYQILDNSAIKSIKKIEPLVNIKNNIKIVLPISFKLDNV